MNTLKALIFFLLIGTSLFSQSKNPGSIEDAEDHVKHGNYLFAIPIFKSELKKDPGNTKIKYQLGLCYLNTRIDRHESMTYLEEASKDPKLEEEVWLNLGKAYHINNKLEEAITAFEKYATLKPKNQAESERLIEQCENAIKFMKKPTNVSFQNLGKEINSTEPDYYPFIDKDEMFLVFTSRRKENVGGKKIEIDGYRSSDIYQSTLDADGRWTTAKSVGRYLNTNLDEQVTGLRSDGMEMYVYLDHIDKFGDIYISNRKDANSEFAKAKICDPSVNAKIETSGCVSEDGSIMIFARRDKISETSDLYMSRKLPSGKWGIPQKLPETVNSPYNEDVPYLSYDGETLYFASDGHNTMGGYDLFKTRWDQKTNKFSEPVNLGFPINSTDDERSICVTQDNRLAYVSAFRPNGFGDLDIYRIKFEDTEPISVIYTGQFFMGDTIPANQPKDYSITITVTNTLTNYEYSFVPHPKTGRYVMALPAGEYKLVTHAKGYLRYKENLTVSDMGKINLERQKDIILKKSTKASANQP
ncbi:MAG: PD40 domain-containing protein [Bacteroidia bacterium]|nr:PD40 domain-containing protein [Bacteroidia bacterium]